MGKDKKRRPFALVFSVILAPELWTWKPDLFQTPIIFQIKWGMFLFQFTHMFPGEFEEITRVIEPLIDNENVESIEVVE